MSRGLLLSLGLALAMLASPAPGLAAFKSNRISVSVQGSGPDVILIPGLAASRGIWGSTASGLRGYRYHLVQVHGFAGTAPAGNASGPVAASAAAEIARYIAENRLQRPAIVGHSMGGSIAMMIGARHSGSAGRVMVVDMLPSPSRAFGISASTVRPLAGFIGREWLGADRLRRDLQGLVGRFGSADWLASGSDAGVVGRSVEELIATDLTPELRRIKAPLTVVYACPKALELGCGGIGRTFTRAYAPRPGTRIVRVERSGHTIMHDQPAVFRSVLKDFLTRP